MSDAMTQAPSVEMVAKALDDLIDGWFGDRAQANLNTADLARAAIEAMNIPALLTETRTKALEEAAAICEWEGAEYVANGKECDAAGNTFGGTVDNASALTCQVLAERIRSLKAEGGEK